MPALSSQPHGHGRSPNWGTYLLLLVGGNVLAFVVHMGLGMFASFYLPTGLSSIVVAVAAIFAAGSWFLTAGGGAWTREERRGLAVAYTAVLAVATAPVLALMVLWSAGFLGQGVTFLVIGGLVSLVSLAAVCAAHYAVARLVLHYLVGRGTRASSPSVAGEFT